MEEILNDILQYNVKKEGNTISILQDIEESFGYLPEEALYWFSEKLNIPISTIYGIATFYNQFHLKKRGKNIITSCRGTACHVRGAKHIVNRFRENLAIADGEDTSEDGEFTIDEVSCIGACGISPVVIVNKKIHCQMTPEEVDDIINQFKKERLD
jgi:NADH:ubiquinone oxidoreductase subunit E